MSHVPGVHTLRATRACGRLGKAAIGERHRSPWCCVDDHVPHMHACCAAAPATRRPRKEGAMSSRLHYIMAFVADMERATRFYRDTLGFPIGFTSPYWTEFATGETTLVLHPASAKHPAGTFGLGLHVGDLQEFCAQMAASGVAWPLPPTAQFGTTMARFLDQEGTELIVGTEAEVDAAGE